MLDSLVRVSRRGNENHFASITRACLSPDQYSIKVSSAWNRPTSTKTICTDPNPCWPIWTHSASAASSTRKMSPNNTGFHRFPFNNFMRLFNSLFKVLFIFPSRYLFAIGLLPIFSFRWNLPPTLSCNPKQLDSLKAWVLSNLLGKNGSLTLSAAFFQRT